MPSDLQAHFLRSVKILQEDSNGLMAIAKPNGLMVHPNTQEGISPKALTPYAYDLERECYSLPNGQKLFLLNRLDAPTSGIMLVTLNAALVAAVRTAFRQHTCRKTYQAWVKGKQYLPSSGLWKDHLLEISGPRGLRVKQSPHGQYSETTYEVMENLFFDKMHHLLRLHLYPKTGRTHQLRVQCASRGLFILGDRLYGDFSWNHAIMPHFSRKILFLHSEKIDLEYQLAAQRYFFSATQAPEEFWDLKTTQFRKK